MRSRIVSLLVLSLITAGLTVAGGGGASAAPTPEGAVYEEVFFPSGDGTMLHGELLKPENGCDGIVNADNSEGCPVIVSMGPYFGSGVQNGPALGYGDLTHSGASNRFFDFFTYKFDTDGDQQGDTNIFEMGYAVLQVDSRGYGSSGGCNDYGGHGEQMDMAAAVTWAGTQSWSNGQVGTWGKSYDAWTQVMGLAENPPHLEAAIIQAPIIDGYGIAYVNGVHHDSGWYLTTNLYALYDYSPPAVANGETSPEELVYPLTGSATEPCWAEQNAQVLNPDRNSAYWVERDLRPRASRNDDVAVFYTHGFTDVNTKPDQVFGVYDGLTANNPENTRAWFGQWDHVRGSDAIGGVGTGEVTDHESWVVGRAGWNEEALDWLNHYLRGEDFAYDVNDHNLVEVQDNEGNWRTEATYPAPDVRYLPLPINPGTYADQASSDGYWTVTPEVTEEFRITGESLVTIDAEVTVPFANFIGVLYDIAPDGTATEISRSIYRIEESGTHTFSSHPGDWIMRTGHRLGFKVMSTHPESFPYPTLQDVTITGGTVEMPVPEYTRVLNLDGVQTTSRSEYSTSITAEDIEAGLIEFDMASLGSIAYPDTDTREQVQGPRNPSTPTD